MLFVLIGWQLEANSIDATLRMKMSQAAPDLSAQDDPTVSSKQYLKEALESGSVLPSEGEQYGTLSCEKIGLSAPLYYGDEEDILQKGVGQYPTDVLPGMGKTCLIAGHDSTYFGCLANVEVKDQIQLNIGDHQLVYHVVNTKVMEADEFVLEEDANQKEQLILYTCYPIGDTDGNRTRRLFVYCELND